MANRQSRVTWLSDDDYCYLTTRGRRTGRPHRIEIWYAVNEPGTLYLLSGGAHASDWVKNLLADPHITVEVDGALRAGRARIIDDRDEAQQARSVVFDKYAPRSQNDLTAWRRRALPIAI